MYDDCKFVVTWDEPDREVEEIIAELWALNGAPFEVTQEDFHRLGLHTLYHVEDEGARKRPESNRFQAGTMQRSQKAGLALRRTAPGSGGARFVGTARHPGATAMEEGPEPQEWVKRAAEEHHHGHAAAAGHTSTTLTAITAAVLAVLASLGSLLSGHAANEAVLAMIRTTDQWAYFQSMSTKGHLYEVGAEVVTALRRRSGTESAQVAAVDHFRAETRRLNRRRPSCSTRPKRSRRRAVTSSTNTTVCACGRGVPGGHRPGLGLAARAAQGDLRPEPRAGAAGLVCLLLGLTA